MGDLGSIPELGRSPGEQLPTPVFWPREFYGLYSPWGCKESDTTEQLAVALALTYHPDWAMECLDIWPNINLDVSVRVFLDEINIKIYRMDKADCTPIS